MHTSDVRFKKQIHKKARNKLIQLHYCTEILLSVGQRKLHSIELYSWLCASYVMSPVICVENMSNVDMFYVNTM